MEDPFTDPSLFHEFERTPEPSDKLILTKFKDDFTVQGTVLSEGVSSKDDQSCGKGKRISFALGSESSADESESDSDGFDSPGDSNPDVIGETDKQNSHTQNGVTSAGNIGKLLSSNKDGRGCLNSGVYVSELEQEIKQLKSELEKVKYQCRNLKRHSRLVDPDKYCPNQEGPAIQVLYMNHNIARKHKAEIDRCLGSLLSSSSADTDHLLQLHSMPTAVCIEDSTAEVNPQEKIRRIKCNTVLGCCHFYKHFTVDSLGWPLVSYNPNLTDGWEIPAYQQVFLEPLPFDEVVEDETHIKSKRPRAGCFNCGGAHNMNKCPEGRDFRRIQENRNNFNQEMDKFASSNPGYRSNRYHADEETDTRFTRFSAGDVSEDLRSALGLSSSQLPPYIYQMRNLGYPPGHLEHARKSGSGIAMFGKQGKELTTYGDLEEGELDSEKSQKDEFDLNKLVEYPGFNVPLPEGSVDEHKKLGMPSIQPCQAKEVMELYLSPATPVAGQKRRSTGNLGGSSAKRQRSSGRGTVDMDLADSGSDEEKQGSSACTSRGDSQSGSRSSTPSLEELERQRKLLQKQLEEAECVEGSDTVEMLVTDSYEAEEGELEGEIPPLPSTPIRPPLPSGTPPVTPVSEARASPSKEAGVFVTPGRLPPLRLPQPKSTPPPPLPMETPPKPPPIPDGTPPATPPNPKRKASSSQVTPGESGFQTPQGSGASMLLKTPSTGGSLCMSLGTPIHLEKTPEGSLKQLPDSDKFADGIAEHIPYENLPDATGTYDKMRRILDKVRTKNV